jgi:hypothetical protein
MERRPSSGVAGTMPELSCLCPKASSRGSGKAESLPNLRPFAVVGLGELCLEPRL